MSTTTDARDVLAFIAEKKWGLGAHSTPRPYDLADAIVGGLFNAGYDIKPRSKFNEMTPDVGRIVHSGKVIGHVVAWSDGDAYDVQVQRLGETTQSRWESIAALLASLRQTAPTEIEWVTE